jgi:hypothetical protein
MRDFRDAKTMAHALQERQARSHGPPLCMLPLTYLSGRSPSLSSGVFAIFAPEMRDGHGRFDAFVP